MTAPLDPRTRLATAAARCAQHGVELLVALVDYAASVTATRVDDPAWGRVDGEHLPPWISAEQYRDACAAGRIDGAVKVGRRWVAPREAVETWALAGVESAWRPTTGRARRGICGLRRHGRGGGGCRRRGYTGVSVPRGDSAGDTRRPRADRRGAGGGRAVRRRAGGARRDGAGEGGRGRRGGGAPRRGAGGARRVSRGR